MSTFSVETGLALRSMEGLTSCGDSAVVERRGAVQLFAVIDALGHGPDAQLSALAASGAVRAAVEAPLSEVFAAAHRALKGLRGAVMAALRVDGAQVTFAGVGNIEVFAPPGVNRPISMAGTLGTPRYRLKEFSVAVEPGHRWVLASDGIKAREVTALLEELRAQPPAAVAQALLQQASRAHDDACALVLDFGAAS